jgi:two-component system OmpR family sensor kinase
MQGCTFERDGHKTLGAKHQTAKLIEAMAVDGMESAEQRESRCIDDVQLRQTISPGSASQDAHAGQAVLAPVTADSAELFEMVEDLRQAIHARDDFVAIAAHELRNSMTPIDGVVGLALGVVRDTKSTCPAHLTVLLERMQRLVDDFIQRAAWLLDVGRLESSNLRLEPSLTDLSTLARSVADRYEVLAARKGSSLVLEIEDGISDLWDPLAMEQIIENLLVNAIKFGMSRPITLQLRSDKQSVWLDVKDCGMGIPPDQRAAIFGRFEQATTQHRGSGFGLGLWIVSRLVAAMNGQIFVASQPGEGSNFTIELPRASDDSV